MAQNDSFQQYLNESNYSPTPISRKLGGSSEGVGGLATGLGRAAEVGADLYKAYDSYKTRQVMEKLDEDLYALQDQYRLGSPTERDEVKQDTANIEKSQETWIKNLPKLDLGFENGEQLDAEISKVPEGLQEKLDFLDRAKGQGRITPKEFALRAKALTQEAVARNPHLTREIVSRLSLKLSASGIQERMALDVDYDEALQKEQDFKFKQITDAFKTLNLFTADYKDKDGNYNIPAMEVAASKGLAEIREAEALKRAAASETIIKQKDIDYIKENGGIPLVTKEYRRNYLTAISEALSSSNNVDEQMVALETSVANINSDIEVGFGTKLGGDPDIRKAMDDTKAYGDTILKAVKSATTLEGRKQMLTNAQAIRTALETEALSAVIGNLELNKFIQQSLSNPNISLLVQGENFNGLKSLMINQALKLSGAAMLVTDLAKNPDTGVSNATSFNQSLITTISQGNVDPKSLEAFNTSVSSRSKVIKGLSSPQERFIEAQQFLTELADPKTATAAQTLSSEVKQETLNLISDQSQPLVKALKTLEAKDVSFGFSPEGTLIVTNNKATSQELTNFVDRVNVNLKAYANLTGMSVKNASKEYFTNLYGDVFNPKEIPNPIDEYKEKAVSLLSTIKKQPESKNEYEFVPSKSGRGVAVPSKVTPYAMTVDSTRRPGFGVAPLDYTKAGKELEKEKDRFRQDYLTQMLVKYNGDERKAYAAFNAGTEVVDKAITIAAKTGEPAMWATKLPEQFGKLLENSKVVVSDKDNALATYIPSLRAKQEQIKTANPQSYDEIFDKGSSVALAQDIQKDLASQGINFTWNAIHQYMEQNNLMPNQAASENQKTEVENVYMKAWETKNNPELFKKLSKQEQEELNLILDPPLESSYPEDFLLGAVGLAKILGLKLSTKVAGKSFNKVFSEDRAITAKPLSKSKIDELNKTDAQRRKVLQEESKPVRNTKGSQTSALEKTKANLNGEDVAIKQKYATLYTKDKKSLENGTITQEEFRNRASDYNRKLKEELAAKGLK